MTGSARVPSSRSLHALSSAGSVVAGSARSHPSLHSKTARSHPSARSHASNSSARWNANGVPIIRANNASTPSKIHHVPPNTAEPMTGGKNAGTPVVSERSAVPMTVGQNEGTPKSASERSAVRPAISTMSARSEREFFPSSAEIGLAQHQEEINGETQIATAAGVPSAEWAYHGASHAFPRFERQKIRAYVDDTIVSGERQVESGILQRIPTMHQPQDDLKGSIHPQVHTPTPAPSSRMAPSARSKSSRALSKASSSSHGSWLRQTEESVLRYKTNNAHYGSFPEVYDTGNNSGFHPGFGNGREVWQLGRFKGKNTSDFENCLVDNNRYVPFLQ